jgi:hypothetical protein
MQRSFQPVLSDRSGILIVRNVRSFRLPGRSGFPVVSVSGLLLELLVFPAHGSVSLFPNIISLSFTVTAMMDDLYPLSVQDLPMFFFKQRDFFDHSSRSGILIVRNVRSFRFGFSVVSALRFVPSITGFPAHGSGSLFPNNISLLFTVTAMILRWA